MSFDIAYSQSVQSGLTHRAIIQGTVDASNDLSDIHCAVAVLIERETVADGPLLEGDVHHIDERVHRDVATAVAFAHALLARRRNED
jgi:hypothetical protein